jgi:hypothetical protein
MNWIISDPVYWYGCFSEIRLKGQSRKMLYSFLARKLISTGILCRTAYGLTFCIVNFLRCLGSYFEAVPMKSSRIMSIVLKNASAITERNRN